MEDDLEVGTRLAEKAVERFDLSAASGGHTTQGVAGALALSFLSALGTEIGPEDAPNFRNTIAALSTIALVAFPAFSTCLEKANSGITQLERRNLLAARLALSLDANPTEVVSTIEEMLDQ